MEVDINFSLRGLWPSLPSIDISNPEQMLPDEKIEKRYTSLIPLILEFQKQHFENLKFSLNLWTIINSGFAISQLNRFTESYTISIILFTVGAIASGAGSILSFTYSNECLFNSLQFSLSSGVSYSKFIETCKNRFYASWKVHSLLLVLSYICALSGVVTLLINR